MSHNLGRLVSDGRTFDHAAGLDLVLSPGPLGGPRFVMLHFDNVSLHSDAQLTVNLGYGTDEFTAGSGANFWSRPVDGAIILIAIRIVGGTGRGVMQRAQRHVSDSITTLRWHLHHGLMMIMHSRWRCL